MDMRTIRRALLALVAVVAAVGVLWAFLYVLVLFNIMSGGSDYPTALVNFLGLDKKADLFGNLQPAISALNARWLPDDTIPTASSGVDQIGSEYWFNIEISSVGSCNASETAPCSTLADELVRIVFDNDAKIEDLTGIQVVIGKNPHELWVEPADVIFREHLTITEWRNRLGL
jgi:hypothetical protein